MKTFKAVLIASATLLGVSGCVSTISQYARNVQKWQGATIDKIVEDWGYPSNVFTAANTGNRVLMYDSSYQQTITGKAYKNKTTTMYITAYGGGVNTDCATFFEFDQQNIVIKISSKGSRCVAPPSWVLMPVMWED